MAQITMRPELAARLYTASELMMKTMTAMATAIMNAQHALTAQERLAALPIARETMLQAESALESLLAVQVEILAEAQRDHGVDVSAGEESLSKARKDFHATLLAHRKTLDEIEAALAGISGSVGSA